MKIIGLMFLVLLTGCATMSSSIKKEKEYVLQNNIGAKYMRFGLWHDAKFHFLKALELAPDKASVYNNLGIVYEYFNQENKAKEFYQKAISLDPQTSAYQKNLILLDKKIGTTTIIKPEPKKNDTGNTKIYTRKIIIRKTVEPKIKIDKIHRVALFSFSEDEENKNTTEITKRIAELFKTKISEQAPFYILEDYEVKNLTQDETITRKDLENPSKRITLNKILSTEGIFVIKVTEFKDDRSKNFELKSYYSQKEKKYVYYRQPYIKRKVKISMSVSFFEGLTNNLLWDKEYKSELSTTYPEENEENIPLFDRRLFKDFIEKPAEDFISDTSPEEKIYERIVVMER